MKKEFVWIDSGRSICMCLVYLFHSENYYGIGDIAYSYFFRPFFLTFFFFISGYLLFVPHQQIDIKYKVKSIFSKMLWPYFIFTSIIYLPKMLRWGNEISFTSYFVNVFGGTASWFIAALIVAELIIVLLSYFIKDNRYYLIIGMLMFISALLLEKITPDINPWYYKSGMMAILFMSFGGIYRYYESNLLCFISKKNLVLIFILYMIVRTFDYYTYHYTPSVGMVRYDSLPLGLIENVFGIIFVLLFCQLFSFPRFLNYIGKKSLIFYFLSGASPTIISFIFHRYNIIPNYVLTIIVAVLSILLSFLSAKIIVKYFPLFLDFNKCKYVNFSR